MKGSVLEGISIEIGGLMQQLTEGKIEHLRNKTTNTPDEGIDHKRRIKGINYFEFIEELKKKNKVGE